MSKFTLWIHVMIKKKSYLKHEMMLLMKNYEQNYKTAESNEVLKGKKPPILFIFCFWQTPAFHTSILF